MGYYALLSSLPMLRLDEASYMTTGRFLESCESFVTVREKAILHNLCLQPSSARFPADSLAARYMSWESALRNALVKLRSNRIGTDSAAWLKPEISFDSTAEAAAAAAFAVPDPLDRERLLDQARWTKLEELESGEHFSFDLLCSYRLKLLLCEKWLARKQESAPENLDTAAEKIRASVK